jgi:serine/threonine-protein kinase RsbW
MTGTDVTLEFTLSNDMAALDRLNDQLNRFRVAAGLATKCFNEVNLALEELFVNFVHYAHPGRCGRHTIRFSLSLADAVLTIRTEDSGMAFNPMSAASPDTKCPLAQRKIGGLGILLIKKAMDEIHYERLGQRNVTTFIKYIDNDATCLEQTAKPS